MNSFRTIIVFLGGPGAGKGTQAQILMRYLPIPQISTGDLLRSEAKLDTHLGRQIAKQISSGNLVGDETVNCALRERVRSTDCARGFILDGYPRTLGQAIALQSQLRPKDKIVVLEIKVDAERLIVRMLSRLICLNCTSVYNSATLKPLIEGVCNNCGGKLVRRTDDEEKVIRERFHAFNTQIFPLRKYFQEIGVYKQIDGMRPPGEVTLDILTVLKVEGMPLKSPVARRTYLTDAQSGGRAWLEDELF